MKRFMFNLTTFIVYSIMMYIVLIPFKMWITGISISLILGFLFGMLNDIIIQLRKMNGEKFPQLDEEDDDHEDED